MPYKKEIAHIFSLEKTNFLCKKRFANVFANIEIQPVFQNRANLKKLVVRTKLVKIYSQQDIIEFKNSTSNTTHAR